MNKESNFCHTLLLHQQLNFSRTKVLQPEPDLGHYTLLALQGFLRKVMMLQSFLLNHLPIFESHPQHSHEFGFNWHSSQRDRWWSILELIYHGERILYKVTEF